jgi:hypothetical protein
MSAEQIVAVSAYAQKNHLGFWDSFKKLIGMGPKTPAKPATTPAATTPAANTTPAATNTPADQSASNQTEKKPEEKSTTDKLKDGAKESWKSASEGVSSGWRRAKGWFSRSERHRILKHMSAEQIVAVSAYAQKNHLGFWDSFKKLIGMGPKTPAKPATTPAATAPAANTTPAATNTPADQSASNQTEKKPEEKSTTDKLKDGAKESWKSASEGVSSGWRRAKGWFSRSERHRSSSSHFASTHFSSLSSSRLPASIVSSESPAHLSSTHLYRNDIVNHLIVSHPNLAPVLTFQIPNAINNSNNLAPSNEFLHFFESMRMILPMDAQDHLFARFIEELSMSWNQGKHFFNDEGLADLHRSLVGNNVNLRLNKGR